MNQGLECLFERLDERLLNGYFVTYHRPENSVENNKFSVEVEKLFVTYDEKGNFRRGFQFLSLLLLIGRELL